MKDEYLNQTDAEIVKSVEEIAKAMGLEESTIRPIENKDDVVNHPRHYIHGGIETIDVIKAWTEELTGFEAVLTGNVIKYISRWKSKNGVEDLKKAAWYLERLIEFEEE